MATTPEADVRHNTPTRGHHESCGQPQGEPTQLEFGQAMSDFRTMFPMLEDDVIEAVLRANNGVVDTTIDQLLTMTLDCEGQATRPPPVGDEDIPPHLLPKHPSDNPPPYPSDLPSYDDLMKSDPMWHQSAMAHMPKPPTPARGISPKHSTKNSQNRSPRSKPQPSIPQSCSPPKNQFHSMSLLDSEFIPESKASGDHVRSTPSKRWHPPLLGPLPADFLRITITDDIIESGPQEFTRSRGSPSHAHIRSSPQGSPHKSKRSSESRRASGGHSSSGARPKSVTGVGSPHRVNPGLSSEVIQQKIAENERRRASACFDHDPEQAQYLEDERLALMMQNEEFLMELQQDEDFMKTLERDRMNATAFEFPDTPERRRTSGSTPSSGGAHMNPRPEPQGASVPQDDTFKLSQPAVWANWQLPEPPRIRTYDSEEDVQLIDVSPPSKKPDTSKPSDDQIIGYGDDSVGEMGAFPYSKQLPHSDSAEFRQQLKYMGKSSRKKFADAAKRFFSRRKKRPSRQLLRDTSAASQMNLLENLEDDSSSTSYNRLHNEPT